jgi:hypothetical protein
MKPTSPTTYNFAVLRAVPHVHLGAFTNVGVIVFAPTLDYLGIRVITDGAELRRRVPEADVELLERYLDSYRAVSEGDESAGPIALGATSERFHWLTSPRSDVLQCSPVHEGVGDDPRHALAELFKTFVGR